MLTAGSTSSGHESLDPFYKYTIQPLKVFRRAGGGGQYQYDSVNVDQGFKLKNQGLIYDCFVLIFATIEKKLGRALTMNVRMTQLRSSLEKATFFVEISIWRYPKVGGDLISYRLGQQVLLLSLGICHENNIFFFFIFNQNL